MNVPQGIRHMRKKSGLNQQFFATAVNMSTRALAQYEDGTRSPEPKQMLALYAYAAKHHPELADLFWDAFIGQVEPLPSLTLTTTERVMDLITAAVHRAYNAATAPDRGTILSSIHQALAASRTTPTPDVIRALTGLAPEEITKIRQQYGVSTE